jgi:hypothetical protein
LTTPGGDGGDSTVRIFEQKGENGIVTYEAYFLN